MKGGGGGTARVRSVADHVGGAAACVVHSLATIKTFKACLLTGEEDWSFGGQAGADMT